MVNILLSEYGFSGLRLLAGFNSRASAAAWLGLSESTLKRREAAADLTLARLLAVKAGWLELIDERWAGWLLRSGSLYYGGREWRPGDLLAQRYERALIAELQRQLRQHEADKKAAATVSGRTLAPVLHLDDYR